MESEKFIIGVFVTMALLFIGHWLPLEMFWGHKVPRLVCYSLGCGAILAGAVVWLGWAGQWGIVWRLAVLFVVAGAAVGIAYVVDGLALLYSRARIIEHKLDE